jgi:hypothetical protein
MRRSLVFSFSFHGHTPVSGVNKRGKTRATRRRTAVRATPKNKDFNEKTSLITRPCFHLSGPLSHLEVCLISFFVSDGVRNYRLRSLLLLIRQHGMIFFFFSFVWVLCVCFFFCFLITFNLIWFVLLNQAEQRDLDLKIWML